MALGTVTRSIATFPPAGTPLGVAFDGHYVWVANGAGANFVYQFDPNTGTVIGSFATPGAATRGICFDGYRMWLIDTTAATIYQINQNNGTVIRSFAAPHNAPTGITFDGGMLWVTDVTQGRVYQVDPETGTSTYSFAAPGAVGVTFDGYRMWVMNSVANCFQMNQNTGAQIRTFASAANSGDIEWDGGKLIIPVNSDNTVKWVSVT
jgi:DNA-binding beta-propeller fold protein YncE